MAAQPTPLALALGRIPTGLYIVTARDGERDIGFVGSLVMQVGFEPPVVCVAIGVDRPHLAAVRASKHFALCVLDKGTEKLMGRFFKPHPPGKSAFDGLAHHRAGRGSPVLDDALAWLECKLVGEHATGDHVVVFGEVLEGGLAREGDPAIHLRKNGLAY
jgi:flavin reductase (DIM6/NTAB) family NADH-FMN oxidoreductase RutF